MVLGSARDIIDEIGIPRSTFTDLPLGNPVGPPGDMAQQKRILRDTLVFAADATLPRSNVQLHVDWPGDETWRDTYMDISDIDALRAAGAARREAQAAKRERQDQSAS